MIVILLCLLALALGYAFFIYLPKSLSQVHREVPFVNPSLPNASDKGTIEQQKAKQKAEMRQQEFEEMMAYDVHTAYKRKGDFR